MPRNSTEITTVAESNDRSDVTLFAPAKSGPHMQTITFQTKEGACLTVRMLEIEGEPWFVAADVLKTFGMYMKADGSVNTGNAIRCLDEDEHTLHQIKGNSRGGGTRRFKALVISESGLYKLVMRSDKPEAKKFQDWVTRDVLPTIRKTGQYNASAAAAVKGEMSLEEMTQNVLEGLKAQVELESEKNERLAQRNVSLT
ncbi:BRO-N domain-containing protein [Cohaesibacter marisflavi]|uniref:BRO-N domain-containing protein n=1 Tax=Cohaesibacter marisflavi TaxID=655353 RepID=UPI0029C68506|nr:BRO family protein [Cohaesibacter marisflavi]